MENYIEKFIKECPTSKNAFILKNKKITYSQFLDDIYACKTLLEKIPSKEPVLICSSPSSYLYYVCTYASLLDGRKICITNKVPSKNVIEKQVDSIVCRYALVDPKYKKYTKLLPSSVNLIFVSKLNKLQKSTKAYEGGGFITFDKDNKPILKSLTYTYLQISILMDNIDEDEELIYSDLVNFSLVVPLLGKTLVLGSSLDKVKKNNPSVIFCSLNTILSYSKKYPFIVKGYLGGNILFQDQVDKIIQTFPNAKLNYFYMLNEGTPLYKTTLDRYKVNPLIFDTPIKGVEINLTHQDSNRVGEIVVTTFIDNQKRSLLNGDLGRLVNNSLQVVGKSSYSISSKAFYNYEFDQNLRRENSKLEGGYSYSYQGERHVVYKGKLNVKEEGVTYNKVKVIPYEDLSNFIFDYEGGKNISKKSRK